MAYKQKPPTFMGSCLKQYMATNGETGETKTFESKEEYHNFKNDDSGTTWTKHAKGLASVELSQDNYNKSKTEGNLNILNRNIAKLSTEDRKIYDRIKADDVSEDVSPIKATAGYNMLMKGAGKIGSHKYTSGSRSYRTEWGDAPDMYTMPDDLYEDDNGGDNGDNGDDDDIDKNSSVNIKKKRRNKNNTKEENKFITTACPVFGEPGSENYRRGMAENKRNMSRADWKIFKEQQKRKLDPHF